MSKEAMGANHPVLNGWDLNMCSVTSCFPSSQNFGLPSSWNHQEPTEIEKLTTVSGEKGASGKKVQCGNSQLVQHCFPMFMDHGGKHMGVFSEDSSHIQRYKNQITHSPFLKITRALGI